MRARPWIAPLSVAAITLLLGLTFVRTGTWSVFDEYTHFDYVSRVSEFTLPPVNDSLGQTALQTAVCESAPGFGTLTNLCGAAFIDPRLAPYDGQSTATSYLPTYYVATGLGARALSAAGLDLIDGARLVGVLYLVVAALLVMGIARRLGARRVIAAAAGIATASMPIVLMQFGTVNNDALAVVFSLAAVYVYLALARRPLVMRAGIAFALSLVGMTVKETALIGVVAVFALVVRDIVTATDVRRLKATVIALAAALASIAVPGILRNVVYPMVVGRLPDNGLQTAEILRLQGTPPINLVAGNALLANITVFQVPEGVLAGVWFSVAAQVLALVAIGLPLAAILSRGALAEFGEQRVTMAIAVIVMLPLFVLAFLALVRVQGLPPFFQPRYLLPIAVLGVPVAASFMHRRWGPAVLAVSVAYAMVVFSALIAAPPWTG